MEAVDFPAPDRQRLQGLPFPVATVRRLRREGMVPVRALGEDLLCLWNGGRPRVVHDHCPHLGLPLSRGRLEGERLRCRYHGWAFSTDDGRAVEQPTLKHPQACGLTRWNCLRWGDLVLAWAGPDPEDAVRLRLPAEPPAGCSVAVVPMEAPWFLALWNAVDYAHFARHRGYARAYALYRQVRRDAHVPGQPFHWERLHEDASSIHFALPEARRRLRLFATCAILEDDGGVNRFETWVTPQGPSRSLYWECYRPRTGRPFAAAVARLAFWSFVVPLLWTEDRRWTGASAPAFLRGGQTLSANDLPLGAHLRRWVLPQGSP
jgi:phenylpropionate dioxygenase-like ring-hydroxylating dioxygenase large terminal subunit